MKNTNFSIYEKLKHVKDQEENKKNSVCQLEELKTFHEELKQTVDLTSFETNQKIQDLKDELFKKHDEHCSKVQDNLKMINEAVKQCVSLEQFNQLQEDVTKSIEEFVIAPAKPQEKTKNLKDKGYLDPLELPLSETSDKKKNLIMNLKIEKK